MDRELVESVAARWAGLGAMVNAEAEPVSDLERLVLDTARVAPANSRLFVLGASWLAAYGHYLAKHRLAQLVLDELEREYRPTLGLLLECATEHGGKSNRSHFNLAIDACGPAVDERPLSDVERRNPTFAKLARERASALSKKWGRWIAEFEPKDNALRPVEWIVERNPMLVERAWMGGDLTSSIVAVCEAESHPVQSETELARKCGASRAAVRHALERLRRANRVTVRRCKRGNTIELRPRLGG